MKIRDFAVKYQIQTDTIRYYEKENLLTPIRRENGYREFDEECEKQIRLIIVLKQLGFTIKGNSTITAITGQQIDINRM